MSTPRTSQVRREWIASQRSDHAAEPRHTAGAAFDRWLAGERQAAASETAKAIRAELQKEFETCSPNCQDGLYNAVDIADAHIKEGTP